MEAGIAMTFTQGYYEAYREEAMTYLAKVLNGMTLEDANTEFNLGTVLPKVVFELTQ